MVSPANSDIEGIVATSNDNVMAFGEDVILFKDSTWTRFPVQAPTHIEKFCAIDTNSIFISHNTKFQESVLYYFDGNRWTQVYHPLANSIVAMSFIDDKNGVLAGIGETAVLEKGEWHFLSPPTYNSFWDVIYREDGEFWALTIGGELFRYKDDWQKIKTKYKFKKIKFFNDAIFVIGDGFLGKIAGDTVDIISTSEKLKNISSFAIVSEKEVFATGLNGLILHYKNGKWTKEDGKTTNNLNSILLTGSDKAWIVGDDGLILEYSSKAGAEIPGSWKGFEKMNIFHNKVSKLVDDEYGVALADFDNDGLTDIFTCGLYEENHLYINNGNLSFFDKARQSYIAGSTGEFRQELNLGTCAVDWDNDGDIDIYAGVLNGKNKLYENAGKDYFVEYSPVINGAGKTNDRTNACIFGDVDNDGDLDLFIANEYSSNRMYLNNGVGIFTEITNQCGLNSNYGGMGCTFGDIDDDGDLDLYVTNWYGENKLYKNLLKEEGRLYFRDITHEAKVQGESYSKSNGVVFADIDNDADLDLFVANRKSSNKIYINNGDGIFEDKTRELLKADLYKTNGVLIADFDGDGYKDIYLSNVGENTFYKNENGRFAVVSSAYGTDISGYSTGSAYADFDGDGDLDIYVANYVGESSMLLINQLNDNRYIKLQIHGVKNNRNGIGCKIYAYEDGGMDNLSALIDFRQITAGSGYASMNGLIQIIPVSDNKFIDLKIIFPTGIIKKIKHIQAGSTLTIPDIDGMKKYLFLFKNLIKRRILDPHELYELIKWIFIVVVIVFASFRGIKRYNWSKLFAVAVAAVLLILYFVQYYNLEFENFVFSTLLPFVSVIGLVLLVHLFFERKRTQRLALVEQEKIREKLSRDLHDDLASTISSIGIYLTLIRYNINDKEGKLPELLHKSESLVRDATSTITDLIWAIKPKPESLENLIIRINNSFAELVREKNTNYKMHYHIPGENIILSPKVKQNVYLILKEAMNNILKYAKAGNVSIEIDKKGVEVSILIQDDGIGFDFDSVKNKGHGLTNMQRRAEDIQAKFKMNSKTGRGTKIELMLFEKVHFGKTENAAG